MQANIIAYLILPVLFAALFFVRLETYDTPIDQWLPYWDSLLIIGSLMLLERVYAYSRAISQRHVLSRDIVSTLVNIYVTASVVAFILLPILIFFLQIFLERRSAFASSAQLGPIWLQILIVMVVISFCRYWIHRLQHKVPFLWELHSYHHRVTDLTGLNILVSHPLDFALRNVVILVVLMVVGFHPLAFLVAIPFTQIAGYVSHCAADIRGGLPNYVFATLRRIAGIMRRRFPKDTNTPSTTASSFPFGTSCSAPSICRAHWPTPNNLSASATRPVWPTSRAT